MNLGGGNGGGASTCLAFGMFIPPCSLEDLAARPLLPLKSYTSIDGGDVTREMSIIGRKYCHELKPSSRRISSSALAPQAERGFFQWWQLRVNPEGEQ